MKYVYIALGVVLLWSASLLWAHHEGSSSERQAQAQKSAKVVKHHKKVRSTVEGQVNALPDAPTVPVATAPSDSASSELLRDWSRPN